MWIIRLHCRINENIRSHFDSKYPYVGCLANIEVPYGPSNTSWWSENLLLAGEYYYALALQNPLHISHRCRGIDLGCSLSVTSYGKGEVHTHCRPEHCASGRRCVQQIGSTFCGCSMTGFNGPICTNGMSHGMQLMLVAPTNLQSFQTKSYSSFVVSMKYF